MKKRVLLGICIMLLGMGMKAEAEDFQAGSEIGIVFKEAYNGGNAGGEDSGEDNKNGQSSGTENPGGGSSGSGTAKSSTGKSTLPQTGEENGREAQAGFMLAGVSATGLLLLKKKR